MLEGTIENFIEDQQFVWFIKRVNKYSERYSFLPDGERKIRIDDEQEGWYKKYSVYKIYDKYTPTIISQDEAWEATILYINRLNEDDLLYQRLIYEYCYN